MDPMAAAGGMPVDPMAGAIPADPMAGMPVDPMAGAPLTVDDIRAVIADELKAAGVSKEEEDTGRVSNKDLGAQVEALTQTLNAVAAAIGVDPVAATEQNPAEAASAAATEPVPELGPEEAEMMAAMGPEAAAITPEEAAMLEAPAPPVGAPPMVDPALMESASAQAMPMPAPSPQMMQMTAEEYQNSDKPAEKGVAHMLLNLRLNR